MPLNFKPIMLVIVDGFGIAPKSPANAISVAQTPFIDSLVKDYPLVLLQASSEAVGLPWGEVGNSEVGHVNIGSGVLKYQSLPRINKSISTGQFFKLPKMMETAEKLKGGKNGNLHIMGMIGNGGVHSTTEHLEALINFAKGAKIKKNVYLHLFLDGRDTAKDSGKNFMEDVLKFCKKQKVGEVASIGGRYFGMDRNKNWDRIEKAYNAILNGQSEKTHSDPIKAIEESYGQEVFDEEIAPTVIVGKGGQPVATIESGDTLMFFNFRADRARQLTEAIISPEFDKFERKKLEDFTFITFTEYQAGLPVDVLFPPELIKTPISKVFSDLNIAQLHTAETEKYAHVTFFFNGMMEDKFAGEERLLVPSPDVSSYDEKPEMSALEVTDGLIKAIKSEKFGFIVVNYANPDMVAHTGNVEATVKAVQTVDECLKKVVPEVAKLGGAVFIVADHGNAEELVNPATGAMDKEHNMYPAPFLLVSNKYTGQPNPDIVEGDISLLTPSGILSDIAPTILTVAGLELPPEMTGTCLFNV